MDTIENFRIYRSKRLKGIASALIKAGIKADHLTSLSLLSGLLAVYFLFNNYYLFTSLAILHLIFDGLDGVAARLSSPTVHGKYFDLLTDSTVTFLILIKAGWHLQEWYAYLAAGVFLLVLVIHLRSGLEAPIIFIRTTSLAILVLATNPLFPFTKIILTAGYLTAGGVSLYSLARQLQWQLQR